MTYTVENLPPEIDEALRERAQSEQKSIEHVIQDALQAYAGMYLNCQKTSDFSDVIGSWQKDSATEAILAEQRQIKSEAEPARYRDLSDIVNGPPLELDVVQAIEDQRSIT